MHEKSHGSVQRFRFNQHNNPESFCRRHSMADFRSIRAVPEVRRDPLSELSSSSAEPSSHIDEQMLAGYERLLVAQARRTVVLPEYKRLFADASLRSRSVGEACRISSEFPDPDADAFWLTEDGGYLWQASQRVMAAPDGIPPLVASFTSEMAEQLSLQRSVVGSLADRQLDNAIQLIDAKPGELIVETGAAAYYKRIERIWAHAQERGAFVVCHDVPPLAAINARNNIPDVLQYFALPRAPHFFGTLLDSADAEKAVSLHNVISRLSLEMLKDLIYSAANGRVDRLVFSQSLSVSENSAIFGDDWAPGSQGRNFDVNVLNFIQSRVADGTIPKSLHLRMGAFSAALGLAVRHRLEQRMLTTLVHALTAYAGEAGFHQINACTVYESECVATDKAMSQMAAFSPLGERMIERELNVFRFGYAGVEVLSDNSVPPGQVRIEHPQLFLEVKKSRENKRPFSPRDKEVIYLDPSGPVVFPSEQVMNNEYLLSQCPVAALLSPAELQLVHLLGTEMADLYIDRGIAMFSPEIRRFNPKIP